MACGEKKGMNIKKKEKKRKVLNGMYGNRLYLDCVLLVWIYFIFVHICHKRRVWSVYVQLEHWFEW